MTGPGILIVDINPEMIQKISAVLEPEGYSIFSANSGEAGIDLAKKVLPSLIFVNAGISEGMRGLEICKTIHEAEELSDIPLVILTPRNVIITERDRELYGIVDYITYIFNEEDLRSKTKDLLSPAPAEKDPEAADTPQDEQEETPESGDDDRAEKPEPDAHRDRTEPEFTDEPLPEQPSEEITDAVPDAVEERGEEPGSEQRGESDLLIPSLSDEEYASAYKKKRLQKSAFFVSLAILLIVIGAGGIIFYDDFSPRSFLQKSQPEMIPPSPSPSGGQHAVETLPPDIPPEPQAVEEKKPAPVPGNTIPPQEPEGKKAPVPVGKPSAQDSARVKPSASPHPQNAAVKPAPKAVYSVQIGVFKQEANAVSLVRQYKAKGYSARIDKGMTNQGAHLYRVLIGKFEAEKDAKQHAETIRTRENIPVVLFRE